MVGLGSERKVYVIGVGMTQFMKPGSREDLDYPQMCVEAVTRALKDARLQYSDLQEAVVGYVYGDSTSGQRALYDLGVTGIPIVNVNNNCATGSSALVVARRIIQSGAASCVLALGFEKMERGPLTSKFHDRTNPLDKHVGKMAELAGTSGAPLVAQLFGNAGIEHMEKYGTKPEHFAKIAYKNHKHSTRNPYAQCQEEYTLEQIMNSPEVFGPLTKLQCCPTSDGSAAAVLADEEFVLKHGLQDQAVLIVAMETCTDLPSTFTSQSHMSLVGYDMTRHAATKLFSKTGYKPSQVDVVELHDCFSTNELISYEALGLCPPGGAAEFIDSGENTYGGRHVVNPSGGMLSKGHPLGATGLAQCAELSWQLRGLAGERQVPDATLALQHNIGLGGSVVVALYRLGFPEHQRKSLTPADNITARRDYTVVKIANPLQRIPKLLLSSKEKAYEKIKHIFGMKEDVVVQEGIPEINNTANEENHKLKLKNKLNDSFIPSDDDEVQSFLKKKTSCEAPFQNKIKQNNGALTPSESTKLSIDAECHLKSKL